MAFWIKLAVHGMACSGEPLTDTRQSMSSQLNPASARAASAARAPIWELVSSSTK
ncbi:hypothetical protein D3C86_2264100 [compost metagenome]